MTIDPKFAELVEFWFPHDLDDADTLRERAALWFGGSASLDALLADRFAVLPDRAAELYEMAAATSLHERLALVLALDQLPRNLYRGSRRAFQYDSVALGIALRIVDEHLDEALHPVMATFIYLPFEHAEDPACQARSVAGYRRLLARSSPALESQFEQFLQYAERHRAVVERFGRFPHRNSVLGRTPTPTEIAYLEAGGDTFG